VSAPAGRRRIVVVAANPSIDRLYEVERLTEGAIHRPLAVVARAGGKGLNAARAAVALGADVTAVGIVAGRAGDWIVEQLAGLGIDAPMARTRGETRSCISILDRSSGLLTELYERGDEIGPGAWDALEASVAAELARGDVGALTLSGSLPPGAPVDGFARIARLARVATADGRSAATSGRVPVLADTYGPALAAVLAERPAVVKVNAAEAGEATGLVVDDAASAAIAAAVLRERGADGVIVTLGVAGAVVVTAGGMARLVPPDIRGAYPVGSGDAFLAGLAAALVDGEPLVEAARRGMAAGIANALLPGAGELDPALAERLAAEVRVTAP
jgi:1-phosphofructokinase family hexose kinase